MSDSAPVWGRYSELRSAELAELRRRTPVAYIPWGAFEWHGSHLPLGSNGIIAEAIAERSARRTGGVLMPTQWWTSGRIASADILPASAELVSALWDTLFAGLARTGWRVAVVVNGVYQPDHDLALMEAAEAGMRRHDLLILAVPPLAMVDEEMLDRGGLWESSLLMALRPDRLDLDELGIRPLSTAEHGIVGRDPRGTASASIGTRTLALAVERLASAVGQLLSEGSATPLQALYERRREHYQALIARHGNSIEALRQAWWGEETE